jgi:hypothetical protein
MRNIRRTFFSLLTILSILWLLAEPSAFQPARFIPLRNAMVQYSGIIAMACMSVVVLQSPLPAEHLAAVATNV